MERQPDTFSTRNENTFGRRIIASLSIGFVFCYYSEYMFWASFTHYNTEVFLQEITAAWLVYSSMTYVVLWLSSHYSVSDFYGWFFVGAIYGWLCEGAVVQTMYMVFPLYISWTGLAWHSLISIVLGGAFFRQAIHSGQTKRILKMVAFFGIFFGCWAPTWWSERGEIIPFEDFFLFIIFFSIPTLFGYILYERYAPTEFVPSKPEKILIIGFFAFLFIFGTIPLVGLLALIWPILIGLTLFLLKKYKEGQPAGQIANPSPLGKFEWRYLWFLGVPFLAIFVFFWFFAATIIIQTSILYLVILMPAGFFFYGKGGYEIMKKARGMTSSTFVNAPSK